MRHLDAIADADPYPYWYDDADEPDSNPTLVRTESCDLCIVGGGYTGLWTAIIAKERDPSRDVILIDAHEVGSAASGRNGGFMDSSLTHGVAKKLNRPFAATTSTATTNALAQLMLQRARTPPRTLQNFVTITNSSVHLGNLLNGSIKRHCAARCTHLLTQVASGAKIAPRLLTPHVLHGA